MTDAKAEDPRLVHVGTVGSTNDLAWEKGRALPPVDTPDPARVLLAIVADEQTKGRGRSGRTWESPPGAGLYFSAYLRPGWPPARAALLTLAAGLAAIEACTAAGVRPVLKWPNDLVAPDDSGRKLGGILSETRSEGGIASEAVIGIGLNLHAPSGGYSGELAGRAVSLEELAQGSAIPDAGALARTLLVRLDEEIRVLARDGGELDLVARARERSGLWGRRVEIEGPSPGKGWSGVARDLADDGGLVVRLDSGAERIVHSGDVRVLWRES